MEGMDEVFQILAIIIKLLNTPNAIFWNNHVCLFFKLSEDSDIIGKDQNGGSDKEDHKYYIAEKVKLGQDHPYIDLDEMNKTNPSLVKEHPMLSRSYRRAATIPLKFRWVTKYFHQA